MRLAAEARFQIFLHPAARADIERDKDVGRRELRKVLFEKYPELPHPPPLTASLVAELGEAPPGTNDWVDHQQVAALEANAVNFLVTEDRKLYKKARRLGLAERVFTIAEAITLIADLTERVPTPPPDVESVPAYAIDPTDPILESFRADYSPGFDKWFARCRLEHRKSWIIRGNSGHLSALSIVKPESEPFDSIRGKILKVCSFKVSDRSNGFRYGELLLKAIFEHATDNTYDWLYVTVFPKHARLVDMFEAFGFSSLRSLTSRGELVLAKPMHPRCNVAIPQTPLAYHIRFGPRLFRGDVPWFLIPIQPRYANALFPESASQQLFAGQMPCGNAIRKAYLCNSSIRTASCGAVLVFYRSHEARGAIAIGILEEAFESRAAMEITQRVGKRTVYSLDSIQGLCRGQVLAYLFRQSLILKPSISASELTTQKVFSRPPQSIMQLKGEGLEWLRKKLAA